MPSDYATPKFTVTYLTEDESTVWQEEYEWVPPAVGHGVVSEDGKRWRIRDVWVVHEKHGAFEYGVYAFISPAAADEDLLARLAPKYYGATHRE